MFWEQCFIYNNPIELTTQKSGPRLATSISVNFGSFKKSYKYNFKHSIVYYPAAV